ncbi:hypothetical protein [Variovorax rhizosphaerae]|uniref:Lipoprotein n=1 Tax=Variovorax rhizosphaerae TaxID=1836200 RepID=A0ABU8WCL5_9BURK
MTGAALTGACALLMGCATRTDMAFKNDADVLKGDSKPVYLMTVTLRNNFKPDYQPKLEEVNVKRDGGRQQPDERLDFRIDFKSMVDLKDAYDTTRPSSYFVRMELAPGSYEIKGLTSRTRTFWIDGLFQTPLNSPLKVDTPGVYYLGHVEASVRQRVGNEFPAGPATPLIDQVVAGASPGTFVVKISDQFEQDEPAFRKRFPALNDVPITKAILPPFDRAKAQANFMPFGARPAK